MRPAALLSIVAVSVLAAGHAGGEPRPAWSEIPVGAIPAAPQHSAAPARVDPSEHVEGLSVERAPVSPFSRHRRTMVAGQDRRCVAANIDFDADGEPNDRSSTTGELRFSTTVSAVRTERLAFAADGKPSLEIVDAWVDPQTLGARELARTSVPLARIGRGPGGVGIYAFRAGEELQVVMPLAGSARYRGHDGEIRFSECAAARASVGAPEAGGAALISASAEDAAHRPGLLTVNVGVSRLSRDPAPVISVAASWAEEEPREGPRPILR